MKTIEGGEMSKLAFVRRVGEDGVERRELFSMRVHVLTDGVGEVVGEFVDAAGVSGCDVGSRADDAYASQEFHRWCHVVQRRVGKVVKLEDDFVFVAARCFKDALYYFYHRAIEGPLLAAVRKTGVEVADGADNQGGECNYGDEVYVMDVLVAVCPQFRELRRRCKREVQPYVGYADCGCEFFTREELMQVFEDVLDEGHDGSIGD